MKYKATCWMMIMDNKNTLIPLQAEFESESLPCVMTINSLYHLGEDALLELAGGCEKVAKILDNITIWRENKFGIWTPLKIYD